MVDTELQFLKADRLLDRAISIIKSGKNTHLAEPYVRQAKEIRDLYFSEIKVLTDTEEPF
jgi:hypothetical protein